MHLLIIEKKPQKDEAEAASVKETSDELVLATSSAVEEVSAAQSDQSAPGGVSAESLEGSKILPPTEVFI